MSLIKVQWRESDENRIITSICPLCVAVVDKDQTVNPCVSVPDSALRVWPGGAKISNTLVIICTCVQILSSGNYQSKGTSERNVYLSVLKPGSLS